MKLNFFVFLIGILGITACCDDNYSCTSETNWPNIIITYDKTDNGFTSSEIDSSYVLVVADSSNQVVDTLRLNDFTPFTTFSNQNGNQQIIHILEEENSNRALTAHYYIIKIGQQSDTINHINYRSEQIVRECPEVCSVYKTIDIEIAEFYEFKFDFNGEQKIFGEVLITK